MLLVLKGSSKLAGRRWADLSPVPERKLRTHQRWETKSSNYLIQASSTFPRRRETAFPGQDTAFPGARKTYTSFFVGTNVTQLLVLNLVSDQVN